jgi:hypothetical protein
VTAALGFLFVLAAIIVRLLLQRNPSLTLAGGSPQQLRSAVDWLFYSGVALCSISYFLFLRRRGTGGLSRFASGKVRTTQFVVPEDNITSYPSYGWTTRCPMCLLPQAKLPRSIRDPHGITCSCIRPECNASILIERFDNVLSFSATETPGVAPRRSEVLYENGVLAGIARDWIGASTAFSAAMQTSKARYLRECLDLAEEARTTRIDPAVGEHMFLSIQAHDRSDSASARREIEEVLRIAPNYGRAHADLGTFLVGGGQVAEATREIELAIRLSPDLARAHHLRALLYQDAGEAASAEKAFHYALKVDPEYGVAHACLAELYSGLKRFDEARAHRDKAIAAGEILNLEKLAIPNRWPYLHEC